MKWKDLQPDPKILAALDHAGVRPVESADQNKKRRWSERFANACAVAVAQALSSAEFPRKSILPKNLESGTEPLTPLGRQTSKRIDVTVCDPTLGLEMGVSLKGLNFRDKRSHNFDKNLTGRLYELGDEVRLVHEHLPRAVMVGLFFLPLASTSDKKVGPSSFAHTMLKLRERTGRFEKAMPTQASQCDQSFVALYSAGDNDTFPPGVCRLFDTSNPPPKRGRPRLENSFTINDFGLHLKRVATGEILPDDWAQAEPED